MDQCGMTPIIFYYTSNFNRPSSLLSFPTSIPICRLPELRQALRYQIVCRGEAWRRLACRGEAWRRLACRGEAWRRLACRGEAWRRLVFYAQNPIFPADLEQNTILTIQASLGI